MSSSLVRVMSVGAVVAFASGACATAESIPYGDWGGAAGNSMQGGGAGKAGTGGAAGGSAGTSGAGGAMGGNAGAGGTGGAAAGNGGAAGSGGATGGSGGSTGGTGGATGGSGGSTGGSGGSTGGSGGASGCQIGTGDATCDGCINAQCSAECITCQDNAECLALLQCIGQCAAGDSACQSSCNTQHPAGTSDAIAFFGSQSGCVKLHCDTQCGGGSGTTLPAGCYTAGTPACNPLTNAGCASDEACDISSSGLQCFPGPNTSGLGDVCLASGPYCEATLTCSPYGDCVNICCSDSDCPGITSCMPFDIAKYGTLGGCL